MKKISYWILSASGLLRKSFHRVDPKRNRSAPWTIEPKGRHFGLRERSARLLILPHSKQRKGESMKSSAQKALWAALALGLVSLPAAGASGAASSDRLGSNSMCREGADRTFSVRECIEDLKTEPMAGATLGLPAGIVKTIGSELIWAPSLVQGVLNHGASSGRFTRTARLEGKVTDLGSHSFEAQQKGDEGGMRLSIELKDHMIRSVDAEYQADGSGVLRFSFANGAQRLVQFEAGLAVSDSADQRVALKSQFYMGCYIGSPALRVYRADVCLRLDETPSHANFKFFLPYTPDYTVWFDLAGCSGLVCTVPISPGQTIAATGYWVINGVPTGPISATAYYSDEPRPGRF